MPGQRIGSLIGAVFGLVYVVVNAGRLSSAACWGLRTAALVLFVAVLTTVLTRRTGRPGPDGDGAAAADAGPAPFGRTYWLIVLVEFAALVVGARLLAGPWDRPHAGVAWVSFVVGTHFFALAAHFGLRFFHVLAAAITACGVAGLALAFAGASAATVAVVGGVVPGFVLLGFAAWGVTRPGPGPPERGPIRSRGS